MALISPYNEQIGTMTLTWSTMVQLSPMCSPRIAESLIGRSFNKSKIMSKSLMLSGFSATKLFSGMTRPAAEKASVEFAILATRI